MWGKLKQRYREGEGDGGIGEGRAGGREGRREGILASL